MYITENADIQQILAPFGVNATDSLCEQIRAYSGLLLRWNQKIALTTVTDPAEIVRFHFGESFFAASLLSPLRGRLADLGSGAGFPGLALKLIAPDLYVTLVESNVKKSTFLSEVARNLRLDGVEVARERIEDYPISCNPFDFVTARALGAHDKTLSWAQPRLATDGRIVLWVSGEDARAISRAQGWAWNPPHLIPKTKDRYILVGEVRK